MKGKVIFTFQMLKQVVWMHSKASTQMKMFVSAWSDPDHLCKTQEMKEMKVPLD